MLFDERLAASSYLSSVDPQNISGHPISMKKIPASFSQDQRVIEATGPNHQQSHREGFVTSGGSMPNGFLNKKHAHASFSGIMVHEELQAVSAQLPRSVPHQHSVDMIRNQSQQRKRKKAPPRTAPVRNAFYTSYEQPQSSHFLLAQRRGPLKKVKRVQNIAHSIIPQKAAHRDAHQTITGMKIQYNAHQTSPQVSARRAAHQNAPQTISQYVEPFVHFGSANSRWTGSASLPPPLDLSPQKQKQKQSPPMKAIASAKVLNFNKGAINQVKGSHGQPKQISKIVKSRGVTPAVKRKGSVVLPISVGKLCKTNTEKSVPRQLPTNKTLHRAQPKQVHSAYMVDAERNSSLNDHGAPIKLVIKKSKTHHTISDQAASLSANHRLPNALPSTLTGNKEVMGNVVPNDYRPGPKSSKPKVAPCRSKPKFVPSVVSTQQQPILSPVTLEGTMIQDNSNVSVSRQAGKKMKTHSKAKNTSPSPRNETAHPIALTVTKNTQLCKSTAKGPKKVQHFCKCCMKPAKKIIPKLKTNRGRLEEQRALALQQLSAKNADPLPIGLTRIIDETSLDSHESPLSGSSDTHLSASEKDQSVNTLHSEICQSEFPKIVLKKLKVSKAKLDEVASLDVTKQANVCGKRKAELRFEEIIQDDLTVIVISAEPEMDPMSDKVVLEYVSTCEKNREPTQYMIPPLACHICLLSFHSFDMYIQHKWSHRGIRRRCARYRNQPTKNAKPPTPKKPLGYKLIRQNSRPIYV